jgi:hypothetical protein
MGGTGAQPKDSLDLTVNAFLEELNKARVAHGLTADRDATRSAMRRALVTWAMLRRTPSDSPQETH